MKTRFFIFALIAVALFSSVTAFAQDTLDSLFYRDGRVEGVIVSKSTSDMIQFSYPNETLQNEILKSELIKIKYSSGRMDQLSVMEDDLSIPEPGFVGEVYLVKENSEYVLLDKEVAQNKYGLRNKYKIMGRAATLRVENNGSMQFVVRANDNESVPMSIITIYKFKPSGNKRKVVVAQHGAGISETVKKFEMPFTAEKYGRSSYTLTASGYDSGEYGITVYNPNNVDEKKEVFNCIGVGEDKGQSRIIWYQGEVNIGGFYGSYLDHYSSPYSDEGKFYGPLISTVHGVRITKYGFIGIGAGLRFSHEEWKSYRHYSSRNSESGLWEDHKDLSDFSKGWEYWYEVYINFKGYIPTRGKFEPYVSVSLGYSDGFLGEFGAGFHYKRFNFSCGYGLISEFGPTNTNFGFLKIGVRI